MERFRNFTSLFAALNLQHLDFSLQPCMPTIASATVEADTCRKYVVPICLGGVGSLFCGLKTFLPRRSQTKAGAFPARHLVHRSSATRNEVGSLGDGGLVAAKCNEDGSLCFTRLRPTPQRRAVASWARNITIPALNPSAGENTG